MKTFEKEFTLLKSFRRELAWARESLQTDQPTILQVDDHPDGLRWEEVFCPLCPIQGENNKFLLMIILKLTQVGPEDDGHRLSVADYNADLSTLGDSMQYNNGKKFSTR